MALLDLERLIFDVYRGGRAAEYLDDPEAFARNYNLTEAERQLLLRQDANGLYDLGVHPMLVMYLARTNGVAIPDHLETLRQGTRVR